MFASKAFRLAAGIALAVGSALAMCVVTASAATAHSRVAAVASSQSAVLGGLRPVRVDVAAGYPVYEFVNRDHNLCLDAAASGDGSNGDKVQLWSCGNRKLNQLWGQPVFNGEWVNQAHGLCLDADKSGDTSNGDKVQLWSCSGASNQLWYYGFPDNQYQLSNKADYSHLCLDAAASGDGSNGDTVQLWACGGGKLNQEWKQN